MHVRRKQILGVQFLRQRPIGNYVVDFLAPTAKLVIEVDGGQHYEDDHEARDVRRDRFLRDQGFAVLRFTNTQMLRETEDVLESVREALVQGLNPPQPPFKKGGRITPPQPPFSKGGSKENPPQPPFSKRGSKENPGEPA